MPGTGEEDAYHSATPATLLSQLQLAPPDPTSLTHAARHTCRCVSDASRPSPDRKQDEAWVGMLLEWSRSTQKNAHVTWHFPKKRKRKAGHYARNNIFLQTEELGMFRLKVPPGAPHRE